MKKTIQTLTGPKVKVMAKIKAKTEAENFSEEEINIASKLVEGGLVSVKKNKDGDTYSLSEEGLEIYSFIS